MASLHSDFPRITTLYPPNSLLYSANLMSIPYKKSTRSLIGTILPKPSSVYRRMACCVPSNDMCPSSGRGSLKVGVKGVEEDVLRSDMSESRRRSEALLRSDMSESWRCRDGGKNSLARYTSARAKAGSGSYVERNTAGGGYRSYEGVA